MARLVAGLILRMRAAYHRALAERRVKQWRDHMALANELEARIAQLNGPQAP